MIREDAPDIRVEVARLWPEDPRYKGRGADVMFRCECGETHVHGAGVVRKRNRTTGDMEWVLDGDPGWRVSHCRLWRKGYNLVAVEREARRPKRPSFNDEIDAAMRASAALLRVEPAL